MDSTQSQPVTTVPSNSTTPKSKSMKDHFNGFMGMFNKSKSDTSTHTTTGGSRKHGHGGSRKHGHGGSRKHGHGGSRKHGHGGSRKHGHGGSRKHGRGGNRR
jgi:hypothetical protein